MKIDKTVEEMEQPAKRWEVKALSDKMDAQSDLLKAALTKLDVLMAQPHVTTDEVREMIKIETDKVYAKYDPIYNNTKLVIGALVVAVIGQLVYVGFQLLGHE